MKYPIFFVAFLISSLFIIANNASGQQRAQQGEATQSRRIHISGYVLNPVGDSLAYAVVAQKGTANGTITDEKGHFDLYLEPADSLIVEFSYMQEVILYHPPVNAKAVKVTVRMQQNAVEYGTLDVTTMRHNTTTLEDLKLDDIRSIPGGSGEISDLIVATQPAVRGTELSSQYSVRGGNYDENIVYVNDIEIYRPLLIRNGQQEGLSFINSDMVQSVSFSAGGFEPRFGDKMSSVLDIRYKKPESFEASVSLSMLGGSAYVGTSGKHFTQIHGVRYKTSRYLLGGLDEKGEYNPNFWDYQTYMTLDLSPKWEVTFLGNFSQNSYEFLPETRETTFGTTDNLQAFTVYFDGKEKDLFRTAFGAMTLNFKPTDLVTLGIMGSAFYTDEEETYDITGQYWLYDVSLDGQKGSAKGVGTYHEHARNKLESSVINISHIGSWKMTSHLVKWGAGVQREIIDDKIREWQMRDSAGYSISPNGYDPHNVALYYNLSGVQSLESVRFQAFLQDTYTKRWDAGTMTLTGGVRAAYWDYNEELLVSPRASVSYSPNWFPEEKRSLMFRFATGLYYQAPFYKELRYAGRDVNGNNVIVLNKDIKAQQTIHFVLGTDYYFPLWNRDFKLTGEAYYKLGTRLTPYQVENLSVTYMSYTKSKGYTAGLDFKLFGEMLPGTDSWVGFSLMKSAEDIKDDKYVDKKTGQMMYPAYIPRPNDQRYGFTMFFQDYFPINPKYTVHLKFIWEDGLPFGPPNGERYQATLRTPDYRRIDIGASRVLRKEDDKFMNNKFFQHIRDINITLEVFNLLNFNNVSSYYWVSDASGMQFAVPNYLTARQLNLKLALNFY